VILHLLILNTIYSGFKPVYSFIELLKTVVNFGFEFLEEFINHICADDAVFHTFILLRDTDKSIDL